MANGKETPIKNDDTPPVEEVLVKAESEEESKLIGGDEAEDVNKDKDLIDYRQYLVTLSVKSEEMFGKTLTTLAGGAIGVSFAFVHNFIEKPPYHQSEFLIGAWFAWMVTLALNLWSHLSSASAIKKGIEQMDNVAKDRSAINKDVNRVETTETFGGSNATLTGWLNWLSLISFLFGLVFAGIFIYKNINRELIETEKSHKPSSLHQKSQQSQPSIPTPISPSSLGSITISPSPLAVQVTPLATQPQPSQKE